MPRPDATVDSSFWIHAYRSGLLPYVLSRFSVWYTLEVGRELSERFPSGREFWRMVRARELDEVTPLRQQVRMFSPGERSAINVVLDRRDWFLLLDDRRPYEEAKRLGINVVCTPLLVAEIVQENTIDTLEARRMLARLAQPRTVSPEMIRQALGML